MAEYRRAEIVSGLFIVLSVIAFAVLALKVKGEPIPFIEEKGVDAEAWFDDIVELDSAAKVTAGGRRIGTVSSIEHRIAPFTETELAEERSRTEELPPGWGPGRERQVVLVRFKILDPELRLAADATVSIVQEGFIGPYHVAVDPGTWEIGKAPPPVKDAKVFPIKIKPKHTETLKDLIPAVKPIIKQVDSILARIDRDLLAPLLEGKREALAGIIPEIQAALVDARKGINEARELLDPVKDGSPVRHFNKLMDDTDGSVIDLKNRITTELLPPIKAAIDDGRDALKAAKKTLEDASALVTENRPQLKEFLANLKEESGRLEKRLDDIQKKLGTFLASADQFVSLQQSDLAVIIETLRNTAWEIEQAARKIRANPSVVIFGTEEKNAVTSEPRDDSGLRKSGRMKPYEKSNETPAKKE